MAVKVSSLDEYRARDSDAVMACVMDDMRKEGTDGLILLWKPRGQPVRVYRTGEYHRHPEKARTLLARAWGQLADREEAAPPITLSGRL